MLYGGFKYLGLNNLGDQIQSIAAERFLPCVNRRFNRDTLSLVSLEETYLLIMNGWFTHNPIKCFPPTNMIYPIFWGFHITNWNKSWNYFLSQKNLNVFKKHEPIGCRDQFTQKKLENAGIDSFYSKCLTITFAKRREIPKSGFNVIVDIPIPLPPAVRDEAIYVSHTISPHIDEEDKIKQAKSLLDLYKSHAKLIVTTRLHCALPCVAMGIPVIFLGNPYDYRVSIIRDIGLKINKLPNNLFLSKMSRKEMNFKIEEMWSKINWQPDPVDVEEEKGEIILKFQSLLRKK